MKTNRQNVCEELTSALMLSKTR